MRRMAMAAATMLARWCRVREQGRHGGGGGAAANWPQRDLRLMAPADPGGGWDGTARAMSQAMTRPR